MTNEEIDEIEEQKRVLAEQDFSEEFQIKSAMFDFYEITSSITPNNQRDKIHLLRAKRNALKDMMLIYLAKFNIFIVI